jgi:hypothetical protein
VRSCFPREYFSVNDVAIGRKGPTNLQKKGKICTLNPILTGKILTRKFRLL